MKRNKQTRFAKAFRIFANIVFYTFLVCCAAFVALIVVSNKNSQGAVSVLGYQLYIVSSDSMEKCDLTDVSEYEIGSLPLRSVVFVHQVPDDKARAAEFYASLKVGDVLTFRYVYTSQVTITHRIVEIAPKMNGSGYLITLAGDNKDADAEILTQTIDTSQDNSTNYIIGKVVGMNYLIGLIMSILKKPVGLICSVIIPCVIIIIFEVKKIADVFRADAKQKAQEEKAAKDAEIEDLKRKLSQLESRTSDTETSAGDSDHTNDS